MPNFGPGFVPSDKTTSDLVRAVRSHAQGGARHGVNALENPFDNDTPELVVQFPISGLQPGMNLEIDWVEYSLLDASPSTKTLTVMPMDDDAPHVVHAAGARITLKPRYTTRRIIEELNNELDQMSGEGLYRVVSVAANSDGSLTLPDGALVVLDAWSNEEFQRQLPSGFYEITESATGPQLLGPNTLSRATIGCTFNYLPPWENVPVADTTGMVPTSLDIPPLGAAIRLLMGTESQRNIIDHQGETRRAGEVPTGGPTQSLQNLAAMRQTRLVSEMARLAQRYGYKQHVGVY